MSAEQAPAADPLDTAAIAGHRGCLGNAQKHYRELGSPSGREK